MPESEEFAFLILHYNVLEATEKCVDSIKALCDSNHIKIFIVDNGSPNGSGIELLKKYETDKQITVILLSDNRGFSAGNNAGFRKIMSMSDPAFLVVTNNDIVFHQSDFIRRVKEEYEQSSFDILGPDIFSPVGEIHQNPILIDLPDKRQTLRTILFNGAAVVFYPLAYGLIKKVLKSTGSFRKADHSGKKDGQSLKREENVILHGSCMIYSSEYLKERLNTDNALFYPETFFYHEEYIQKLWCNRHNKKTVFQPEIRVLHMHWKATGTVAATEKKQVLFIIKNIRDAAKIYYRCLCGRDR